MGAAGLSDLPPRPSRLSQRIFANSYRLQVKGIDAVSNPTEMVYVETVRNRTSKILIGEPMTRGRYALPVFIPENKTRIAFQVGRARPVPTAGKSIEVYFLQEPSDSCIDGRFKISRALRW